MAKPTPSYHVLLIGIDNYAIAPLYGCVNDIDTVQGILLDRMAIPPDRITRLASPRMGTSTSTAVPSQRASLDNVRAAFAELDSSKVAATDRVFIYYAGHGTRVAVRSAGGVFYREALVPVDYVPGQCGRRLLFDFELNELLRAIADKTPQVSMVIDCCFAAGTTRSGAGSSGRRTRCLEIGDAGGRGMAIDDPAGASARSYSDRRVHSSGPGVDSCHVVAACLDHELATEDGDHGLLSAAFTTALATANDSELATIPWARIWQPMRAHMQAVWAAQHPAMFGNAGRAVFGGPPVDGDPGIAVTQRDAGDQRVYHLEAGRLADITPDTELAVYGELPRYFPALDSTAATDQPLGLVRVTDAERATAIAHAVGSVFELPPGARARVVKAGAWARLRYAVVPANPGLEAALAGSPLLEAAVPPESADVTLTYFQGRWLVTDDVHLAQADAAILCALRPSELDCARAVLEHYYAYSRPLRLAAQALDLEGKLTLNVLSCPDRTLSAEEAQAAETDPVSPLVPEAALRGVDYALTSGAAVCFRVRNGWKEPIRVTLINCAASGKVQLLGDCVVPDGAFHIFWGRSGLGAPVYMRQPDARKQCIDRLIAIGRTNEAHELGHLRVDGTFAQAAQRLRHATRDADAGTPPEATPLEHWTAAQVVIETRDRYS